ncbi:hypothetical protein NQZ68_005624 [Dissostichus eleginoides]|nr:hypothetical protein NQZ68_005624 [Dissostichus eleginoides]
MIGQRAFRGVALRKESVIVLCSLSAWPFLSDSRASRRPETLSWHAIGCYKLPQYDLTANNNKKAITQLNSAD